MKNILSRRDFLKLSGTALGGFAFTELGLIPQTPPFEVFVLNNNNQASYLVVRDLITNYISISVGTIEQGVTDSGNDATFFTQNGVLAEAPIKSKLDAPHIDVHSGTSTELLTTADKSVNAANVMIWPDMLGGDIKEAQTKLDKAFSKWIDNGSVQPVEFQGLTGYPGTASLMVVKGLIDKQPDHLLITFKTPNEEEVIKSVRLEALRLSYDADVGFGNVSLPRDRSRIIFPARTPGSPEPALPVELQEKFAELGAELGEDENGKPIYFVTNPAGETVVVGKMNEEENKWESADAIKFKLFETVEEAEASGEIMDTEYVLRGGPGQAAKLNGEPFPEDVLTGLNIEVVKPNWKDPYNDQLNFDATGISLLKNSPNKTPYRIAGYFKYLNKFNNIEQPGYGCVWQWINPDKSIVYTTTITSINPPSTYVLTPFANFNFTKDVSSVAPILDKIGHDEETNRLMLQWAETDIVPSELQDLALLLSYRFK